MSAVIRVVSLIVLAISAVSAAQQQAAPEAALSVTRPSSDGQFDGPAELPRVSIKSSLADTPAHGKTWDVKPGTKLTEFMGKVNCGDTVRLPSGETFGELVLPEKPCDDNHWIIIRTSAPDAQLPPEGNRMNPCYAGVASLPGRPSFSCNVKTTALARFEHTTGGPGPVMFAPNANHYRLIGLEITRAEELKSVPGLVVLKTAHHIVLDRLWIHGTAQGETARGVALAGSRYVAVVDSYINDFHCIARAGACTDAQAIGGGFGNDPMGPYKIVNNFLEASGENILLGGAGGSETPYDIEIRHNHFFKPQTWKPNSDNFVGGPGGQPFIVKNLFELKNAGRVLLEGNVLENAWGGFSQNGYGILLTPKNQNALCPECRVHDVTIRYNVIRNTGAGMQIANGAAAQGALARAGERYSIHDILMENVNGEANQGNGTIFQISTVNPVLNRVSIDHITVIAETAKILLMIGNMTGTKMAGFQLTNSILPAGRYEVFSTGGGKDNCAFGREAPRNTLNNCFSSHLVKGNVFVGGSGGWPDGNQAVGNLEKVGFVNPSTGDYRLCRGKNDPAPCERASRVAGMAGGKDPGADLEALNAAISGVL